jgi:hypothetical protein
MTERTLLTAVGVVMALDVVIAAVLTLLRGWPLWFVS